MGLLLAPLLLAVSSPSSRDSVAVTKTVGWFQGPVHDLNAQGQSAFLASTKIADRIMPCCNGLSVDVNGTLSMPWGIPFNGSIYTGKEILFNLTIY